MYIPRYQPRRSATTAVKPPVITPARLRFFKLREAAARRQIAEHGRHVWFVRGKPSSLFVSKRDPTTLGLVEAVRVQQNRLTRLGVN